MSGFKEVTTMSEREERFERMLQEIQAEYAAIEQKMAVNVNENLSQVLTNI